MNTQAYWFAALGIPLTRLRRPRLQDMLLPLARAFPTSYALADCFCRQPSGAAAERLHRGPLAVECDSGIPEDVLRNSDASSYRAALRRHTRTHQPPELVSEFGIDIGIRALWRRLAESATLTSVAPPFGD